MCMVCFVEAHAQTVLSGKVTDKDNQPVIGATVYVESVGSGAITDLDGNYTINFAIPDGATIEYAYMGMKSQIVNYNPNQTLRNVVLMDETEQIEEVVVVGYGQQKKETVVGSIAQAQGDDLLRAGNVSTVSEALTGLMPGVTTMQLSGSPGDTAANILIRGQSSWTSTQPLYVVDGVERDFNDLDPNEIESISVLKDASATAVFGVKAANGVILVTTKQGSIGKPRVSVSYSMTVKNPTIDSDVMLDNASSLEHYNNAAYNDGSFGLMIPQSRIDSWRDPNADPRFYSQSNFVEDYLKSGISQQANVNVSGGTDFVRYFVSLGYNYDGDMFDIDEQEFYDPRTMQQRYNYRTNLDFKLTKSTKLSVKLSGDVKDWQGNPATADGGVADSNSSALARMYTAIQVGAPYKLPDGRYAATSVDTTGTNYLEAFEGSGSEETRSNRLYTDFILTQQIFKDLYVQGKLSYNQSREYDSEAELGSSIYWVYDEGEEDYIPADPSKVPKMPSYKQDVLKAYKKDLYYEASLNYNKKIDRHSFSALALFNRRIYQNKVAFPYYEESWVGRVTYDYDRRYMFEANGAYNGNENFAPGMRFGFFPSLAVGWNISQEAFFKDNVSWIDQLKVRYSYGQIGSDRGIGSNRWLYMSGYEEKSNTNLSYLYGSTEESPYYYESQVGDPNSTWETAVKQNIGLEFSVLDSRLRTTFDLFKEDRDGILMEMNNIPTWYGTDAPMANLGRTKNHGFDLELVWNDRISKDFSYWAKANLSISENRVVYRDDLKNSYIHKQQAGKPMSNNTGLLDNGLYQDMDDLYNYTQSSYVTSLNTGDLIYVDYTGDGVIDDDDIVSIYSPSAALKSYAATAGITYKGFGVTAMFNGVFDMYKTLSPYYLWPTNTINTNPNFQMANNATLDYWSLYNTDADSPAVHTIANAHNEKSSTYTHANASFLRLRNLEFKYNFSSLLKKKMSFVSNLEVYVSGQNLFTWSGLDESMDPEAKSLTVYPIAKRYNFGIRFSM